MDGPAKPLGIDVALVQSGFTPQDYRSADAFGSRVAALVELALSGRRRPSLVAFPELTGMWLPLLCDGIPRSVAALAALSVLRHPLRAASSLIRGRGLSFVFSRDWKRHFHAWIEPFREAASRHAVYVCPGSTFLPRIDRDSTRDWELHDERIWNTSCLLGPRGRILALTRKVYPMPDELRLGVRPGRPEELQVARTDIGRIGILICLDGFYESLVSRIDTAGAEIVIQPSANPVPWKAALRDGRWVPPGEGRAGEVTQEEQWLSLGIGSLIQGRESVRASLNPMSVSRILGHNDEGQSSIFRNASGRSRESGAYPGLLARAEPWDRETVLRARI